MELDYIINPGIILLWFPYQNRTFSNWKPYVLDMETVRFSIGEHKKKTPWNRYWTFQSYIGSYLPSKLIGKIKTTSYNKCNSLATSSARMELPTCNFSKIFCRWSEILPLQRAVEFLLRVHCKKKIVIIVKKKWFANYTIGIWELEVTPTLLFYNPRYCRRTFW